MTRYHLGKLAALLCVLCWSGTPAAGQGWPSRNWPAQFQPATPPGIQFGPGARRAGQAPLTTQPAGEQITKIWSLKHIAPEIVAAQIQELYGDTFTFRCVPAAFSKSLVVSGSPDLISKVETLIRSLDIQPEPISMRVYQLKHAKAEQLQQAISGMMGGRVTCSADPRSNTLVVRAGDEPMKIVDEMLTQLDRPVEGAATQPADSGQRLSFLPLNRVIPNDSFTKIVDMVLGGRGIFAIDRSRNVLVVKADENDTRQLASILHELEDRQLMDEPPAKPKQAAMRVRVVWLITPSKDGPVAPPPPDLNQVIEELRKIGVTGLGLAAQSTVQTLAGVEFTLKNSFKLDNPCELTIKGKLFDSTRDTPPTAPSLQFDLKAIEYTPWELHNPPGSPSSHNVVAQYGYKELCNVNTTMSAPPGHAVVLGVAPTGDRTSVFVIQILPGE